MQTITAATGRPRRAPAPLRAARPTAVRAGRPAGHDTTLTLAVETLGSGPPLAVLHGLFGCGSHWRTVAQRLAEAHTVHLVDLRNHGGSPHAGAMDYLQMADDVVHTLRGLEPGPVDLLGHGVGGKTAMAVALRHAAFVRRLVVVDSAPVAGAAPLPPSAAAHADARADLAAIAASAAALAGFPESLRARCFPRPALVLAGDEAGCVTPGELRHFAPRFPAYRVVSLCGAGHWVHADQPLAFTDAVLRFLAEAPARH